MDLNLSLHPDDRAIAGQRAVLRKLGQRRPCPAGDPGKARLGKWGTKLGVVNDSPTPGGTAGRPLCDERRRVVSAHLPKPATVARSSAG